MKQDAMAVTAGVPTPVKPRFYEICQTYNLDYQAMQTIAEKAGLPKQVVDSMSVSVAVCRWQASAVLAALSEHTGYTCTFDNVKVALLPTFQDLHTIYQFDLAILSTMSGVSFDTIGVMLSGEPIKEEEARLVLRAASKQSGQNLNYTVSNVDVTLAKVKEQGGAATLTPFKAAKERIHP